LQVLTHNTTNLTRFKEIVQTCAKMSDKNLKG